MRPRAVTDIDNLAPFEDDFSHGSQLTSRAWELGSLIRPNEISFPSNPRGKVKPRTPTPLK